MIFSLDILRARKGDCFLLHYGDAADPRLMLIDGGPSQVYAPQLKPRLARLRAARRLPAAAPVVIDLVLVSHIDDDHIVGLLELTGELAEAQAARRRLSLKLRGLWHNSFDDVLGESPEELRAAVTSAFGPASLDGEADTEGLDPVSARVLASTAQGIRLRDNARALGLPVNREFAGRLVMAVEGAPPLDLGDGLTFVVAGPLRRDLLALEREHDTFLREQARERSKTALSAFTDTSIPNLSSLVVLAAAGGRRMLLTGDARGDKILQGLEVAGVLAPGGRLHVDVLKMPHHGSDRNMTRGFLERVTADHYVFSGDGEHGNPERATLDMLRLARGTAGYAIHLTYPPADNDVAREADWKKEQQRERARQLRRADAVVRADWSPAANGLEAFFAAHADMAARLVVSAPGAAHVIDLLDPLGF